MNNFYHQIEQLSPQKRQWLARRLAERQPANFAAGGGDRRLVAYVVCHTEAEAPIAELKAALKKVLPDYMIPSAFVLLDALPRTPNGKVDRQALPEPQPESPAGTTGFVAPRNPAEELLAGIWSELLGVEPVGVYDNFFELGGHSLLVAQAISRIRDVFEVSLPLGALFETPTLAELAALIEQALITELADLPEAEIPPAGTDQ